MAQAVTQQITCPKCGASSGFTTWIAFDNASDEALGALRERRLFTYECPSCGTAMTVEYSCMYHNPEKNITVFYTPDDDEAAAIEGLFAQPREGLPAEFGAENTRRVVRTHDDLLDKITALEDGLDDRAIELAKIVTLIRASTEFEISGNEGAWYAGLAPDEDGALRIQVDPEGDGERFEYPIPRIVYEGIVKQLAGEDSSGVFSVNRAWARDFRDRMYH